MTNLTKLYNWIGGERMKKQRERVRDSKVWKFTYRGFNCEVVNWKIDEISVIRENDIWNGYIYINKEQYPNDFDKLKVRSYKSDLPSGRRYWRYGKLDNLFDLHGGITYYEVLRDEFSGKVAGIKAGCDYAHIFDDNQYIDENIVMDDLQSSVDKLIINLPDYRVWNPKDGSYIKP